MNRKPKVELTPRVAKENYTEYLLCIDEALRNAAISVGALAVELSGHVVKLPEAVQLGGWIVAGVAGFGAAWEGFSAFIQTDRRRPIVPLPSDMKASGEVDWDIRRRQYLGARQAEIEELYRPEPGAKILGPIYPSDPDFWLADWRDCLPPGDPLRESGSPIVRNGTPEAYASMRAADAAIRQAYARPPELIPKEELYL